MSQRMDYNATTPAGMKALGGVYGHIMNSGLTKLLVDLVYLRVSQINGCAYCVNLHANDLRQADEPQVRLDQLVVWRHSPHFTDAERAAFSRTTTI